MKSNLHRDDANRIVVELTLRVEALEEQIEEQLEKLREFEEGDADYHTTVERLTDERDDAIRRVEELTGALETAISDIQTLPEVPLGGVPEAIDAIVAEIRVAL